MPSHSLLTWQSRSAVALDEIEAAHAAVGGSQPGRRYATQQINQAYVVLVASRFQAFARNLHTEAVDHLVSAAPAGQVRRVLQQGITTDRKLDSRNANEYTIGADFDRIGLSLWKEVQLLDVRNNGRLKQLAVLNAWRNAVAHQDFDPVKLGGSIVRLAEVRRWRRACDRLAEAIDRTVRRHLMSLVGTPPWP